MDDADQVYFSKEDEEDEVITELEADEAFQVHKHVYFAENEDDLPKDFDSHLINAVKQYPCLYNNKHRATEECIEEAWVNVSSQLFQSGEHFFNFIFTPTVNFTLYNNY